MWHTCEKSIYRQYTTHSCCLDQLNNTCLYCLLNPIESNALTHGTLATIYRQRGCFEDCEAVLDVELEVLTRYKRSSEGAREAQVCAKLHAGGSSRPMHAAAVVGIILCSCILLRRLSLQVPAHPLQPLPSGWLTSSKHISLYNT